jgi:hypothetical protein
VGGFLNRDPDEFNQFGVGANHTRSYAQRRRSLPSKTAVETTRRRGGVTARGMK